MPTRWRAERRGAALLEALVALAILATVGSAAAWTASESMRAVWRAHEREHDTRAAARLLTAASLWSREDLDRHLGSRRQGPWRMRIDRPRPTRYDVTLTDTATGMVVLRTSFWRPEAR
jgi:type II secretory pathway pseudopilin PulG